MQKQLQHLQAVDPFDAQNNIELAMVVGQNHNSVPMVVQQNNNSLPTVVRQINNSLPIVVEPIEAQNIIWLPIVVARAHRGTK